MKSELEVPDKLKTLMEWFQLPNIPWDKLLAVTKVDFEPQHPIGSMERHLEYATFLVELLGKDPNLYDEMEKIIEQGRGQCHSSVIGQNS